MPDPARKSLTILNEIYDKVKDRYELEVPDGDISLIKWFSSFTLLNLEKDEFLKTYAPFLSKKSIDGNSVIMKDDKLNKLVEVTYKDGKFWCDHDEKDCCTHIHFALALPELAKLNR